MFTRFATIIKRDIKRDKRVRRIPQKDIVAEQVKKVLEDADQKLILMVRG